MVMVTVFFVSLVEEVLSFALLGVRQFRHTSTSVYRKTGKQVGNLLSALTGCNCQLSCVKFRRVSTGV